MGSRRMIAAGIVGLLICATCNGSIIYVDDDATGANDGSSWKDSYIHLQDALTAASQGDEIHVGQGTYCPDRGTGLTLGSREATFHLVDGVTVYGGFRGVTMQDPHIRDVDKYKTILSGDLNTDDLPQW